MAKGYRRVDRDQPFLMPPDLREWVPADHPVHWVIGMVEQLDTSELHRQRRTGGVGRQGYDPDMMLTLLIWSWAEGQRSSRRIERLCAQDVAYRYICAGNLPDHTVIARFRQAAGEVVAGLFAQVLVICAELGMVRLGVVALDGTKIAADASLGVNRSEEALVAALQRQAAKAAAEHERADRDDDQQFGVDGRGDGVPDDPGTPSSRQKRLQQALDRVRQRQQEQLEQRDSKPTSLKGNSRTGSTPEQVELAQKKLDLARAKHQAKIDHYEAKKAAGTLHGGRRPAPMQDSSRVNRAQEILDNIKARRGKPGPRPADRHGHPLRPALCNTTDPESGLQPRQDGGWIQGYNCQALTSTDGIIIATSVSASPSDTPTFQPMVTAGVQVAERLAQHRPEDADPAHTRIGLVLADAGYLSKDNLTCDGPDRLIAIGRRRQLEQQARDNPAHGQIEPDTDPITAMSHRLRTPAGMKAYRQRGHIAETPFAEIKHNRRFRRMTGRGLLRATADWTFNAMVHNLLKANRHITATG